MKAELDRYNNHQVHSTTGEIPQIRFEKARKSGNSLFRKLTLPPPYTSPKDVTIIKFTPQPEKSLAFVLRGRSLRATVSSDLSLFLNPIPPLMMFFACAKREGSMPTAAFPFSDTIFESLIRPCINTLISIWFQIQKRTPWIFAFGGMKLWFTHSPFHWKVF
ncbi:MAG: hypothetical protein R6U57_01310 [Anaerolineales bacterium]